MNPRIQEARDAALEVLKPAPAQIEHGLALHRDALVVESYGFAPRGPYDVDLLRATLEANAESLEMQDLVENMTMTAVTHSASARAEFQDAWDAAGVTCILQNAGEESNEIHTLIKRLAHFTYTADCIRDIAPRAVSPDDIVEAKSRNRHCFYTVANGVPLAQRWRTVQDELSYIRVFFQLGIRMMHLTYNRGNMIGQGCGEANDGGLTDLGRAVVAEMNRVGVIVDVAHSGHKTSLDAALCSTKPMCASHTVAHALSGHYRGKPDHVIHAICDTGGFVGLCAIPGFLGGSGDLNAWLDHADYLIKTFGADHVAIGMDTAYSPQDPPGMETLKWPKRPAHWRSLWPAPGANDPPGLSCAQRLSLAWTNWPIFTVGLVQRGHSDEAIRKILGGNVMRVARALWDSRAP